MLRERQIALTAKFVKATTRVPGGRGLLRVAQNLPVARELYNAAMGYRRPFATLTEAKAALARLPVEGHESAANVPHHMEFATAARPSDYAAMFHLQPIAGQMLRVFDLGGNAGNLYYCYAKYLPLPETMTWTVLDLPVNMLAGEAIARDRGETRLRFSDDWQRASGVDVLISSGSQHYFEKTLAQMVGELAEKPKHILINRTPLTEGSEFAVVQVASGFRLPCLIRNRAALLGGLEQLGYQVIDEWKAPELGVEVAGYPERSVSAYSGAFLRLA